MVTSLMLVYKGLDGAMPWPRVASSTNNSTPQLSVTVKKEDKSQETPPVPQKKPPVPQKTPPVPQKTLPVPTTLQGYVGFMDQKPLKMHCKTCALVTSSGHVIGSKRGKEIDQSECVIRMNDAPSIGHQADVGQRTTVRIIAHASMARVLRNKQQLFNACQDTVFIFWGPSQVMRRDGKGHVFNGARLLKQEMPKLQIYFISQMQMLKYDYLFNKETGLDRRKTNSWLSTGWFSMATALKLCDRIDVFGMTSPDFCKNRSPSQRPVPYHYYEPLGPKECSMYLRHEMGRQGSHRFITEKAVFSNWARNNTIYFHQPDWKPSAVRNSSSAAGS